MYKSYFAICTPIYAYDIITLMETIYYITTFIFAVVFIAFLLGLIRPSLLQKLLGKRARRKYILIGGLLFCLRIVYT